jgi:hypothetical protein
MHVSYSMRLWLFSASLVVTLSTSGLEVWVLPPLNAGEFTNVTCTQCQTSSSSHHTLKDTSSGPKLGAIVPPCSLYQSEVESEECRSCYEHGVTLVNSDLLP